MNKWNTDRIMFNRTIYIKRSSLLFCTMNTSTSCRPGQSVLIVDDNPIFVQRMRALLDDVQTIESINVAGGYTEATLLIAEKKPTVVLLDIDMPPGKNGICLLKDIRESGDPCHVIMISNRTEECYRHQCNLLGADYFLDKSNDFAKVPSILSQL